MDEEAYAYLTRAKRTARESFSKVIKRGRWDDGKRRCGDLLKRAKGWMDDEALDALDRAQEADREPGSKWDH